MRKLINATSVSALIIGTSLPMATSASPATPPAARTWAATAARGRVGGPASHWDRVRAGATDVYRERFRAGELATVWINGDGDTDLDCYVYDAGGHLIDSDTDSSDICLLQWTPAWTGSFSIEIRNLGGVSNRYVIETN